MSDAPATWGDLGFTSTEAGPGVYYTLSRDGLLRVWIATAERPGGGPEDPVDREPDYQDLVHDFTDLKDRYGGIAPRMAVTWAMRIGVEAAWRAGGLVKAR